MLRIFAVILFIFCINISNAQTRRREVISAYVINGDTILYIQLPEVVVTGKAKKRSQRYYERQYRNQTRLEYNVKKVYPYARMAANKINEIELKLSKIKKESERKEALKEEYSQLMKNFKEPLTRLSVSQGRILIKLIYRETNNTSFTHIREYRGSVNAYFWQSLALLFGHNLKSTYDPCGEDAEIEAIVLKIEKGEM